VTGRGFSNRQPPRVDSRPELRRRRRHPEILEAASRVFDEKGYESTSIQDIAEEVGMLKGSLYYYIRSKEDLLYEILLDVHERAFATIDEVKALDVDSLTKVRAFVTLHVIFNIENLVRVGTFIKDFRSLSEERRQVIAQERRRYDEFLRQLIRDGQKERLICPDVDPKLISLGILGMANWVYNWYRPLGAASARTVANEFAEFVVAGLGCTPATHKPGHRSGLAQLPWELPSATIGGASQPDSSRA
jgi:TetR/AcrR family transcriptional regulator, cholesterol catabolism regulator